MTEDTFALHRFMSAQQDTFATALSELRAGRKQGHWMWFIFPQLRGLGHSSMTQFYSIFSLDEARAYLAHGVLGPRLYETTRAVTSAEGLSLRPIFGTPDDLKFHSSMTLFTLASSVAENPFRDSLERWFAGSMDDATLNLLGKS